MNNWFEYTVKCVVCGKLFILNYMFDVVCSNCKNEKCHEETTTD